MKTAFDIIESGACPDGKTLDTEAIQRAIDACHQAGGGLVMCGPGTFLTGSLELKSNVELRLAPGCRLVGSPHLADYTPLEADGFRAGLAPEKSAISLIRAANAENIAITGAGIIQGSGLAFYNDRAGAGKLEKPDTPRPRIGMFYRCRGIRIQDTAFVDSACWTLWLMQCEGAQIHRVAITGNRRMRNVDGIDLDACRDVTVSDCRINTEDDCLVLRSIQALYDSPAVCENIVVANCLLDSGCQGVRVGCPSDGIIRNCVFSNLTIESENNGIVFDNPRRYLQPESTCSAHITNIMFSNVLINCRQTPIRIAVEDGIALQRLSDLNFSGFRIQSGGPCLVQGSPETVIRNVSFNDMRIETSGDNALLCRHCDGVRLSNVELSNRAGE